MCIKWGYRQVRCVYNLHITRDKCTCVSPIVMAGNFTMALSICRLLYTYLRYSWFNKLSTYLYVRVYIIMCVYRSLRCGLYNIHYIRIIFLQLKMKWILIRGRRPGNMVLVLTVVFVQLRCLYFIWWILLYIMYIDNQGSGIL